MLLDNPYYVLYFVNLVPGILNSCCIVKLIYQCKGSISLVLHSLFEGAYYNTRMGELCAVYLRAQTKQGCEVIK